ncbi:DUF397 domain-containing protein [Streptomyces sp. DSM 42041]|uniref:DUF397 domain-containing protein n=1 Tax=Streptomyces hazeniae TaxID=3075538 RepID=A0ABU2NNT3_9ACTN|nr:DUF397 domain-containing protein [Streptomyces sp. DSM 42041]MDT0378639.1 DUF397 domain-containing protein [Streptomyces sp. DSM 42041]
MAETGWQKSSFSSGDPNTNCVEVDGGGHGVRLRESEEPSTVLAASADALHALLTHLKAGDARTH